MTFQKRKRKSDETKEPSKKKLKRKTQKSIGGDVCKAEYLNIQTIREGMLLLGCIFKIRSDRLMMSLPGCLVGTVARTNISKKYTEILKNCTKSEDSEEVTLESLFELGAFYPCKVLQIVRDASKLPTITLSIDPEVVNSNIKCQSLYTKMVLYAAVVSVEDHGYVMNLGISGKHGFLAFEDSISNKLLNPGQVIPTYLKNLPSQKNDENVLCLAGLSFNDTFPEILDEDIKLSAILPGARVTAYVTEVAQSFIYMKFLNYNVCSSAISPDKSYKKMIEATRVSGTVLYVHPIKNYIFLQLGPLPSPSSYSNFFNLQKYNKIKNVKFCGYSDNKLIFKYKNCIGYVKSSDCADKTSLSRESLKKNPIIPKARVVFLHYMDNLVQLTFKKTLLNLKIIKLEDVEIGDVFEAKVTKHVEDGMYVSICPGLSGFVRHLFLSDAFITMPEKIYSVGSIVKCRVLSVHPELGLQLTSKDSLMNLTTSEVLKNYEEAAVGNSFKGVIVQKTDEHMLVLFFNNVKGIISSENIPESSVFFVGQTVLCTVVNCNPKKRKLMLSLNYKKPKVMKIPSRRTVKGGMAANSNEVFPAIIDNRKKIFLSEDENVSNKNIHSFRQSSPTPEFSATKPYSAFIKKITDQQLNILVNGTEKGRIHITEIGCSSENALPLKHFRVGQRIKVHVLYKYKEHSHNYLAISHPNWTSFLECSLNYPPPVLVDEHFDITQSQIGFVKKVCDVYALVWLSPYHTGMLDFVNFPEKPKVLRKLKKTLKVGQSLSVSILPSSRSSEKEVKKIKLITQGTLVPKVGKNIVGLIVIASPNKNLVLKLPYGYSGIVYLTDVLDVPAALQPILEKYLKLKYVFCHVLEVDHQKKTCILSLRTSRLYSKNKTTSQNYYPEMTAETLEEGKTVKGYIKSVHDKHIIVNIGRNIYGKVPLHKCSTYGCAICLKIKDVLSCSAIGNVIEVIIKSIAPKDSFIPLSLPGISSLNCIEDIRLDVKEDINWDELQ